MNDENKVLNPKKLEHRLSNWIGFGDIDADFWFLGTEEGGATTFKEQQLRISLPPVSDLADFIKDLNEIPEVRAPWMIENPPLQKTWSGLIRIYLCATGLCGFDKPTKGKQVRVLTEKVREFQRDKFGRVGQNMLVTELMPLSSKNMGSWKYNQLSNRHDLQSRERYLEEWMPKRKQMFKELIREYNPKVILAYGKGYWDNYLDLTDENEFIPIVNGFAKTNGSFVLIPHTGNAVSNENLELVGHWINENVLHELQ